jgi:sorbitol/mannitol transport system permease protein
MTMSKPAWTKIGLTILGWLVGAMFFYPIFWMAITAFKTEKGAYSPDIFFLPTLESF